MIKIYLYDQWEDTPDHPVRSFRTIGRSSIQLDVTKSASTGTIRRVSNKARTKPQPKLVLIKGTDYENALVGTGEEITSFVKDCLVDLNLMSKSWSKKK